MDSSTAEQITDAPSSLSAAPMEEPKQAPQESDQDHLLDELSDGPCVTVVSLSGASLAEVRPVPACVLDLKLAIEMQTEVPIALQQLVSQTDPDATYADTDCLSPDESLELLLLMDETPLYSWDFEGNPDKDFLVVNGSVVECPQMSSDYINVVTQEPMRSGVHYIEFVMHHIGDEQWCGLVADKSQAGRRAGGRCLKGWTYYCGRMSSSSGSIVDGKGALQAQGRAVTEFTKLSRSGDVIGMLVDLDSGALAFDLNGKLQGACAIPKQPMYVITHVDTPRDRVELRKLSLEESPPANLEALSGALLELSKGVPIGYGDSMDFYGDDSDQDDDSDE